MTVVWSFPTRILFGEDSVKELGTEAKRLGATCALVVSDPGVVKAGILEPVEEALDGAGIKHARFTEISSNPYEAELLAGAEAFKSAGADLVVAVGGGSALDIGKLIRLAATHPLPLEQYDDAIGGDSKITLPMAPMIAVATTAGTGSEVGRSGVVTLASTKRKTVIFSPKLLANVAILDPALTKGLPPFTTAATGFDAFTHCIEAYCALGDHPMADAIAMAGIRLVWQNLDRVVSEPDDLVARGNMLKASMMGAVAFQKGLGACHSLAHPLSAEHELHHGLANALCLPAVLDFNRSAIFAKLARIARAIGVRGEDEETLAFECSGAVRALRRRVGLPNGLHAVGIPEDDLGRLAELAMEDACHTLNPRPCTKEDMLSLYRASM